MFYVIGWTALFLFLWAAYRASNRRRDYEVVLGVIACAEMAAFVGIACMIGYDDAHAILWGVLLATEVAVSILTWKRLVNHYKVQKFADWLTENEVPVKRLGNAFLHSHNRLVCRQYGGVEHTMRIR